jgi:hypothetical protein
MSSSIISAGHRSVSLLSSGIPNLNFNRFPVDGKSFGCELDPDGCFTFHIELVFSKLGNNI